MGSVTGGPLDEKRKADFAVKFLFQTRKSKGVGVGRLVGLSIWPEGGIDSIKGVIVCSSSL